MIPSARSDVTGDGDVDEDDSDIITAAAGQALNEDGDTHPTFGSARGKGLGELAPFFSTGLCDVGHQGLFFDKEFGLYYNRDRYVHPVLGRFNQPDRTDYPDGMNRFEYLVSCPLGRFDPYGRYVEWWRSGAIVGPGEAVKITRRAVSWSDRLTGAYLWYRGIPPQYDTSELVRAGFRQFVYNNNALLALSAKFNPGGTNASSSNRFVFTCRFGWIDLGHYFWTATGGFWWGEKKAYHVGIGVEVAQHIGLILNQFVPPEISRGLRLDDWAASAWGGEDLVSNMLGAHLGGRVRRNTAKFGQNREEQGRIALKTGFEVYSISKDLAYLLNNSGAVEPGGDIIQRFLGVETGVMRILKQDAKEMNERTRGRVPLYGLLHPEPYRGYAHACLCDGNRLKPAYQRDPVEVSARRSIWSPTNPAPELPVPNPLPWGPRTIPVPAPVFGASGLTEPYDVSTQLTLP